MANYKRGKIKISLLGSYSGNNKGDLAIVQAIVSNLIHKLPGIEIHIPSKNPSQPERFLPKQDNILVYRTITAYLGPQSLKRLRRADCLVYGGGGLFFDRKLYSPFYSHLLNLFTVTLLNKLLFKKPIYLFSVGVSKLDNRLARFMTKFILANASHISVRDERSQRVFSELTDKKIHLRYDPALLLKPKSDQEVDQFVQQFTREKTLLICLNQTAKKYTSELVTLIERFAKDHNVILYQNNRKQTIANYLWGELEDHRNIYKINFRNPKSETLNPKQILNSNVQNPKRLPAEALAKAGFGHLSFGNLCLFRISDLALRICRRKHLNKLSPGEIIYLFSKADYIMSFPMHGGIFAYLTGKPTALINYDPKVRELGKIIGNELVVEPKEFSAITPQLIQKRGISRRSIEKVKKCALQNFTDLKDFLDLKLRSNSQKHRSCDIVPAPSAKPFSGCRLQ